eukprot:m.263026 g.263026  ORF g.263026 m.263026 type:complete len:470 (-) comp19235_c0_seq2:209-1618(-)
MYHGTDEQDEGQARGTTWRRTHRLERIPSQCSATSATKPRLDRPAAQTRARNQASTSRQLGHDSQRGPGRQGGPNPNVRVHSVWQTCQHPARCAAAVVAALIIALLVVPGTQPPDGLEGMADVTENVTQALVAAAHTLSGVKDAPSAVSIRRVSNSLAAAAGKCKAVASLEASVCDGATKLRKNASKAVDQAGDVVDQHLLKYDAILAALVELKSYLDDVTAKVLQLCPWCVRLFGGFVGACVAEVDGTTLLALLADVKNASRNAVANLLAMPSVDLKEARMTLKSALDDFPDAITKAHTGYQNAKAAGKEQDQNAIESVLTKLQDAQDDLKAYHGHLRYGVLDHNRAAKAAATARTLGKLGRLTDSQKTTTVNKETIPGDGDLHNTPNDVEVLKLSVHRLQQLVSAVTLAIDTFTRSNCELQLRWDGRAHENCLWLIVELQAECRKIPRDARREWLFPADCNLMSLMR